MLKENLTDRVRVEDRIEEIFEIICLYKNDPTLTMEQYVYKIQKLENEIRLIIKQTLQKEIQKIAEDVIGEKKKPIDNEWDDGYCNGYNLKITELIKYFQSIGIDINI